MILAILTVSNTRFCWPLWKRQTNKRGFQKPKRYNKEKSLKNSLKSLWRSTIRCSEKQNCLKHSYLQEIYSIKYHNYHFSTWKIWTSTDNCFRILKSIYFIYLICICFQKHIFSLLLLAQNYEIQEQVFRVLKTIIYLSAIMSFVQQLFYKH